MKSDDVFNPQIYQDDQVDEEALQEAFFRELPGLDPEATRGIFARIQDHFSGAEMAEVCGRVLETINAECGADDFHRWDYDHLEFIIELARDFDLIIPRNLLNGLPEQLILLVEAKRLGDPGCDDRER
ncbi:hypothetical protein AU468_07150 [Alkalispirochaeta sphaeroplastigenens]|uniref:Uncharacterized protein n=1 Tax=Alkalispirochaeta sphaeroplastigenens TaxID=1187066 RepID=A0A2S4JR62_9SPIO|nr:hypothetical protein [Alkalispirochaeta sphaeroplastigenens]POR02024.1 hypothetical protein AU468_07150 [Alkalispirochaeta sphaeroplastigenens]